MIIIIIITIIITVTITIKEREKKKLRKKCDLPLGLIWGERAVNISDWGVCGGVSVNGSGDGG